MKTAGTDIELIEKYLKGKLKPDEAKDFGERLENDREFARKFRLRKSFPSLFNAEGEDEIAQIIQKAQEDVGEKDKTHFPGVTYIVLGIIVLVAGVLIWFIVTRTAPTGQKSENLKPVAKNVEKLPVRQPALSKPIPAIPEPQAPEKTLSPAPAVTANMPIELETPADNMTIKRGEEILFRWKQKTDSFTNLYIISESSHKLAWWRGIRPGIREMKIPAANFKPGRFYWYVGTRVIRRTLVITQ